MKVALFDYGAGNLHSLAKAIEAEGAQVCITSDPEQMLANDALVLPGVGAFQAATAALPLDRGPVRDALRAGFPCLGICLGMQLLFEESDEGGGAGLGVIEGRVSRLQARTVPQIGWGDVEVTDDPLFDGVDGLVAYFAHSFICEPTDPGVEIGYSDADGKRFVSAVRRGATWGVQFHPEKSSAQGRRMIANFLGQVSG